MKISSILITGLFVGAAGAFAGILFAPGEGYKTRNKLTRKGNLFKDFLMDNFYDLADSVSHPFESMEFQTIRIRKKAINKAKRIEDEMLQKVNDI